MPHPQAHLYLRANGNFGGNYATNQEKWSAGLRIGVIGADIVYNPAGLNTLVNQCHAAFSTFHSSASALVGSTCYFMNCSLARVGTDGKYDPKQQETLYSVGVQQPGSGTATQPWNTAGVVSLRTANFRGYASNGRFYYPQLIGSLDPTTGRLTSTTQQARVTALKTMFDTINASAAAYAVNARILVSSATGVTAAVVTSIRVDDRLDSIERRENAAPAVWKTATLN